MRKVIIDHDPGIDDTLALSSAAKSPGIEIVATIVACGDIPADIGTQSVPKCLECCDHLDIPIYQGMGEPLKQSFISVQDIHSIDGLGEINFPMILRRQAEPLHTVDFLADYFKEKANTSIITLGPLINIAFALKVNPNIGRHMDRLVLMDGTYKSHGNCSPITECNYWCDPEAAPYVSGGLKQTIEMVGLDVTGETVSIPTILEYCCQMNPEEGEYLKAITRFYFDFHWKREEILGCVINDPLAAAYFIEKAIYEDFKSLAAVETQRISREQTLVDRYEFWQRPTNSKIMTEVDTRLFFRKLLAALLNTQKETIMKDLERLEMG